MIIFAVLLFGAVIGALARFLLPGRQDLSGSATVLAGLIGAGTVGGAVAGVTDRGLDWAGPSITGSVLGAAVVVSLLEWVNRRRTARARNVPTDQLLARGEDSGVEFKSSARHNLKTGDKDARVELAIARTVAGFANTKGGTVLIGVDDDGHPIGLDADVQHVKGGDLDRYELWLHDLLERCLSRRALRHIAMAFDTSAADRSAGSTSRQRTLRSTCDRTRASDAHSSTSGRATRHESSLWTTPSTTSYRCRGLRSLVGEAAAQSRSTDVDLAAKVCARRAAAGRMVRSETVLATLLP